MGAQHVRHVVMWVAVQVPCIDGEGGGGGGGGGGGDDGTGACGMPDGGMVFTQIANLRPLPAECTFSRCLPMIAVWCSTSHHKFYYSLQLACTIDQISGDTSDILSK
jgi:hypothetical protein